MAKIELINEQLKEVQNRDNHHFISTLRFRSLIICRGAEQLDILDVTWQNISKILQCACLSISIVDTPPCFSLDH